MAETCDASSSPFSSIPTSPGEDDDVETVKEYLEKLSVAVVKSWDRTDGDADFTVARRYCSPDFELDNRPEFDWPHTKTLEALFALSIKLKQANPYWAVNAYNFSTSLDAERQNAVVWYTSGPSGGGGADPKGSAPWWTTNRESVGQMRWRRRKGKGDVDGEWQCWKHTIIRGGGGFVEAGV